MLNTEHSLINGLHTFKMQRGEKSDDKPFGLKAAHTTAEVFVGELLIVKAALKVKTIVQAAAVRDQE